MRYFNWISRQKDKHDIYCWNDEYENDKKRSIITALRGIFKDSPVVLSRFASLLCEILTRAFVRDSR